MKKGDAPDVAVDAWEGPAECSACRFHDRPPNPATVAISNPIKLIGFVGLAGIWSSL
jgi:hypothetical protein